MRRLIQILIILLCIVLLTGMTVIIVRYRSDLQERSAHIAELSAQAKEYESELQQLRREQETQEMQLYTPEGPGVAVIAFRIDGEETLAKVQEYGAEYGITPAILVNVDDEAIDSILELLPETGFEIILSCRDFNAGTPTQLRAVQETLEETNCVNSHSFLLLAKCDTEENRLVLARAGITTLFLYGDVLSSAVTDDGAIELNYSYISKSSYSPANRLSALENSEQSLLFAIDLVQTTVTEQQVEDILSLIREEVDAGHIVVSNVSGAVQTVQNRVDREQERLKEFLTAQESRSARITELEETIREIYSHWDD